MIPKVEEHHLLGTRSCINSELWRACAGPLVDLPAIGSLVYYFPQGHSEQVAISTRGTSISQIPNYANLSSQLLCQVHKVTMHADKDTDEIYAQMNLQPVNSECDVIPVPDNSVQPSKHPAEFFCKTLTASDTSTHGGFSIPRRAAEKLFPPLDLAVQPPSQELLFRDLHNSAWPFRHIYRGQPKRHLLTSGWSLFVGAKRLKAGDAVLFVRDENSSLLIGIRRTVRHPATLPSSVLSADSMHIGILAAAAQASATNTPFKVYYNPRSCLSEFIVPLVKYRKAVYGAKLSYGTRFGMMFETEESGKRRCMGTITGISDLDPFRWPGSKWRNLQVEWDEPGCSDRVVRVSAWDIDTPENHLVLSKRPPPPPDSDWSDFRKRRQVVLNQTPANSVVFSGQAPTFQNPMDLAAIDCWLEETDDFRNPNAAVLDPVRMLEETVINPIPYFDGFCDRADRLDFDYSNPAVYTAGGRQPPEIHHSTSANFCSSQDVQSQITSGSVIAASSGGGSSAGDCSLLHNRPRPIRTYTKVQKTGSVGRCVDVSGFGNYEELRRAIEGMFGLEGLLNDTCRSGWKLVYVDYENDILLVGDDPWEEFVGCVRCIRILSPPEVQRMSEDGAHQLAY